MHRAQYSIYSSSSVGGPQFLKNGLIQEEGYRWCLKTFNKLSSKKQLDPKRINLSAKFGFYYTDNKQNEIVCFCCGESLKDHVSPAFPNLHLPDCAVVYDKNIIVPKPNSSETPTDDSGYETPLDPSLTISGSPQIIIAEAAEPRKVVQAGSEKKPVLFPDAKQSVQSPSPSNSMSTTPQNISTVPPPAIPARHSLPINKVSRDDQLLNIVEKFKGGFKKANRKDETKERLPLLLQPKTQALGEGNDSSDSEILSPATEELLSFPPNDICNRSCEGRKCFRSPLHTSSDDSDDDIRSKYLLNDEKNIRYSDALTLSQIRAFETDLDLTTEKDRRVTFGSWSVLSNNSVAKDLLAKSGYYYVGPEKHVQCIYCGWEITAWKETNDVITKHHTISPDCKNRVEIVVSFCQGTVAPPVSDQEPEAPSWLRKERGSRQHDCINPINPSMKRVDTRIRSFDQRWPKKMSQETIEQIARAGFFYFGEKDRVKCFYCNKGLESLDENDDPFAKHSAMNPRCEFFLQCKARKTSASSRQHPGQQRPSPEMMTTAVAASSRTKTNTLPSPPEPQLAQPGMQSFQPEEKPSSDQCKKCHHSAATVVLLPCRHLSVCEPCSRSIDSCPQCQKHVNHTFKICRD